MVAKTVPKTLFRLATYILWNDFASIGVEPCDFLGTAFVREERNLHLVCCNACSNYIVCRIGGNTPKLLTGLAGCCSNRRAVVAVGRTPASKKLENPVFGSDKILRIV